MTKRAHLFLSMLLFFSAVGAKADCPPLNADDPFAKAAVMSVGPFLGHCIDTYKYRAGRRLTTDERTGFFSTSELAQLAAAGITDVTAPDIDVVANFQGTDSKGQDHFWVAVIPLEKVFGAIAQITVLNKFPTVEHGQMRVRLTTNGRPVMLIDQTNTLPRLVTELNDDIVMTISGVKPIDNDVKYDPVEGMRNGYYDEEFSIGSLQSEDINWIVSAGLVSNQYVLNVTADQARASLVKGITLATTNGVNQPYQDLRSSCSNVMFLVLHEVFNTSDSGEWRKVVQSVTPVLALQVIGLVNWDGSSRIGDLPEKPAKK